MHFWKPKQSAHWYRSYYYIVSITIKHCYRLHGEYFRNLPNKGSTLITTISNETVAPVVEMRVVDLRTQEETTDTQIGQELQLIIELKEKTSTELFFRMIVTVIWTSFVDTYDLWASHLIAMTEKGEESIFLLDDRGCPTNLNIFPALSKTTTNGTRRLVATFQAFKFASSPVVRFSVLIQFCSNQCSPVRFIKNCIKAFNANGLFLR